MPLNAHVLKSRAWHLQQSNDDPSVFSESTCDKSKFSKPGNFPSASLLSKLKRLDVVDVVVAVVLVIVVVLKVLVVSSFSTFGKSGLMVGLKGFTIESAGFVRKPPVVPEVVIIVEARVGKSVVVVI